MFLCVDSFHRDLRGPKPAALGLSLGEDCHRRTIGLVVEDHLIAVQWSRHGCFDQLLRQGVFRSEEVGSPFLGFLPIKQIVPCRAQWGAARLVHETSLCG